MIRAILLSLSFVFGLSQVSIPREPGAEVWLRGNGAGKSRLDVTDVAVEKDEIIVSSAGVSTFYFGPFQSPSGVVERPRMFRFRIPRFPAPAQSQSGIRSDAFGVFVNGIPVFNQTSLSSYRNQNLWHVDEIALADNGQRVSGPVISGGSRREVSWGLVENLVIDSSAHSPIIGYAFDGFPIYGPFGEVNGRLRQMRSSYRLRKITSRNLLPNGTELLPGQEGAAISAEFPLGYFSEDYEYVAGSGDLDEYNGRYCRTPEYPGGTYAYFLSTSGDGRLAYPYIGAEKYFGKVKPEELDRALIDLAEGLPEPAPGKQLAKMRQGELTLSINGDSLAEGVPLKMSFEAAGNSGESIRYLEYQHERPLHLIVVSQDLSEFHHIHPLLKAGNRYEVEHIFRGGGRYKLYADFALPGKERRVEAFELTLGGPVRPAARLIAGGSHISREQGIELELEVPETLAAGKDILLGLKIRDLKTGALPDRLVPYLGAWAHFMIIDEANQRFIHVHPLEDSVAAASQNHDHSISPTPPEKIAGAINFATPGLYRLWAQVQLGDEVITRSFDLRVTGSAELVSTDIPREAIRISVGSDGFSPSTVSATTGRKILLAVTRSTEPNCASRILFPTLGIMKAAEPGETIIIEIPPQPEGDLRFSCGMRMFKGVLKIEAR